jgi:DNA-binding response OmpR family regulator
MIGIASDVQASQNSAAASAGRRAMFNAIPKVVVIENNALIGLELADVLTAEAGCSVCATVDSVEAALSAIAQHRPDLVVADLRVVTAQGYPVAAIQSEHHRLMLFTGDQQAADEYVGTSIPVLLKPFSSSDFVQKVAAALQDARIAQ